MFKIILIIILLHEIVLLFGFLFIILVASILAHKITRPRCFTRSENIANIEKEKALIVDPNLKREEVTFTMSDGYVIHGDISLQDTPTKKFCIALHGFTATREGAIMYGDIFYHLGYNLLVYDQRGHGDNKRCDISMGYFEAQDLAEIIGKLKTEYGEDIEIVLHGVSMGAATAILCLQYIKNIKYVVSDSCYVSLKAIMGELIHKYIIGAYLYVPYIDRFLQNRHGFGLDNVEPFKVLQDTSVPILFFHGAKDVFVKVHNVDKLYNYTKSVKEKWIFADSGHGNCIVHQRANYTKIIQDFDSKINQLNSGNNDKNTL